jgi:hypothetical protein
MNEIDTTNMMFLGNVVLTLERDSEVISFTGQGNDKLLTVQHLNARGGIRFTKNMSLQDACHEIVDSYVNGFTIGKNVLLRRGIYTALDVAKGKSEVIEKDGEEY